VVGWAGSYSLSIGYATLWKVSREREFRVERGAMDGEREVIGDKGE